MGVRPHLHSRQEGGVALVHEHVARCEGLAVKAGGDDESDGNGGNGLLNFLRVSLLLVTRGPFFALVQPKSLGPQS